MPRYGVKCATRTCYRRLKMTPQEIQKVRDEGAAEGVRSGLLCPSCVKVALNDDDGVRYAVNLDLGDYLVEVAKTEPDWHVVFLPNKAKAAEQRLA